MLQFIKYSLILLLAANFTVYASEDSVRQNLLRMLPENMEIKRIEATPMEGVYLVVTSAQTLYAYSIGNHIMIGDVYDAERKVNLGEERKFAAMGKALADIPESEMIVMGQPTGRYVTVFTDTDCYYCQQFHQNVVELQARGMQVRYLMFPRAGIGSESYHEAVSVWCAEDQGKAMTIAKSGGTVPRLSCDNPVEKQYDLGQKLGVRGTPTLVLDTGKVIPGLLSPDQLLVEAGM